MRIRPVHLEFGSAAERLYRKRMTTKLATILILVAVLVTAVQPARAEAFEPTTVLLIAGGVAVVVALVAVLVIANVREHQRGEAAVAPDAPRLIAMAP